MRIFIDADGCPVVDIAINIAKEFDIEIVVVKNYAHVIKDPYATIVSVDISRDSADFYIVNAVNKGDIVITQDYGLAAMCLSKESIPINQNGIVYTQDNIDGMLNRRYLHQQLRKQNKFYGKAKKRSPEADKKFEYSFRKLIESLM
ncbi:MAG: YaiI/YqxD family protein [Tissierellaceae bacterium]|nr:YaiI/YqxD family protein [Tissierellaceae bacterium]